MAFEIVLLQRQRGMHVPTDPTDSWDLHRFRPAVNTDSVSPTDSWDLHSFSRSDSTESDDLTDSWDLDSVRRADSMALLLEPKVSGTDLGAPPDEPTPQRKTKSMILGTRGVGQERGCRRGRVGFSPSFLDSVHTVTAYATQYGVHPSFFNFGRAGEMRLTDLGIVEDRRRQEKGLDPLMLHGQELF